MREYSRSMILLYFLETVSEHSDMFEEMHRRYIIVIRHRVISMTSVPSILRVSHQYSDQFFVLYSTSSLEYMSTIFANLIPYSLILRTSRIDSCNTLKLSRLLSIHRQTRVFLHHLQIALLMNFHFLLVNTFTPGRDSHHPSV